MSPDELTCWKCGANLKSVPLPYGRRSECPACRAELHACRMCRHYAPGKAKQCMEPMAEEVQDKARGNFCDWFQPAPQAAGQNTGKDKRAALDDLFGGGTVTGTSESARRALDDLFGD